MISLGDKVVAGKKLCEHLDEKLHYLIVYTAPLGLVTYFGVIVKEA